MTPRCHFFRISDDFIDFDPGIAEKFEYTTIFES